MSVIVGIDPGFSALGWAAADLGEPPGLLAVGCVRTKPGKAALLKSEDNAARLRELWRGLQALRALKPVAIAVESQSWPRNAGAAAKVAMTWGLVVALAEELRAPLIHCSPQNVKLATTGRRDASKDEVLEGLQRKSGWPVAEACDRQDIPRSLWEHPTDAAAAIWCALDTELGRAVRRSA